MSGLRGAGRGRPAAGRSRLRLPDRGRVPPGTGRRGRQPRPHRPAPDNYDSFTRSRGLLSDADAQAYIRLLSAHAHEKGLAIGQKNTAELAGQRQANGLDFAVAEECGEQDNCDEFTPAFGDHVIVIEYTDAGLANACDRWGGSLSIVRRDHDVVPEGEAGYVRKTC